ncbi:hypothetical protein BofuT4_uP147930.1 [Botrytis cinerea T4]|uniref:Uncharacterized protein n=1 Tax=Botryotinia fuckeliana (strain T4) TaxID=999810 RepID=G2YXL2_BOTF4|nr:hypothetical protein BofuT4_uP147930.1 [Botrytis cinerea T4]
MTISTPPLYTPRSIHSFYGSAYWPKNPKESVVDRSPKIALLTVECEDKIFLFSIRR